MLIVPVDVPVKKGNSLIVAVSETFQMIRGRSTRCISKKSPFGFFF